MLTTKQINQRITKAVKATSGMREAVQEAVFACIEHIYIHGDVSLLNRLVSELPKGFQAEKLKQFIAATAPVRVNKSELQAKKGIFTFRAIKDEEETKVKQGILLHCPWYDYQPANSDKPKADITTASIFANALKSMVTRLQEHTDLNPLEQQALEALKAAVESRIA